MPVELHLEDAHPGFRRSIPSILLPLAERYPGAKITSVSLYRPDRGDTSMAQALPSGEIRLNSYWFTRDPADLSKAAQKHAIVDVDGSPMGWHGPMLAEPPQVLTHEFGHCVWNGLPQDLVEGWSSERWREATRSPHLAPSGYALASPPEFFGEMFALCELGLATDDEVRDLAELTRRLR